MERVEKNTKLNLLKGIGCMGVVFIHFTFPGAFGEIVAYISAFAVPVFLMTAGYYAYGKKEEVIRRRLIKILEILFFAYILYFAFNAATAVSNHELMNWLSRQFTVKAIIKLIVFCTIEFAIPLWYLIAMAEVYILWYIIVKHGRERAALKWMPVLFVLQVLLTTYCETMELDWFWKINFLTRGMPWFLLGYYLCSEESKKLRCISTGALALMTAAGCLIVLVPFVFDLPVKFNAAGYIPFALALFLLTLKDSSKSICAPIEFIGDKLSLNIYVFHYLIGNVVNILSVRILKVDINRNAAYLWTMPVVTLALSILFSWAIYSVQSRRAQRS